MTAKERLQHEMHVEVLESLAIKNAIRSAESEFNGNNDDANFQFGAACAYAAAHAMISGGDLDVSEIKLNRLSELEKEES